MEDIKKRSGRGGARPGSGRPALGKKAMTFKLSKESYEKLQTIKNKSEYVDALIKAAK